ncbi:hypothetical protein [Capnocytophaga leadbetteri]|uniref:hypothetical protein n=1 Tax=Capnocytophaga leadbetteri TaxID=327575 RepID=UPI0028EEA238|nr:hypothetical protein [Capnocytophaga leadbetteri]
MDMRIQKTLLLISLLLVVMYSCKNTNSNDKIEQAKDSIVNIASDDIVLNNPLAGKKFYYLEKDKTGTLILKKYPQFEGDFEMQKIIFTDSMLIDGWNVMEPSEWYVSKIIQKDTILSYYVNMEPFGSAKDTFRLQYDKEKGKLYMFVENNIITLIDSLYSDRVKIKNVKVKLEDD